MEGVRKGGRGDRMRKGSEEGRERSVIPCCKNERQAYLAHWRSVVPREV